MHVCVSENEAEQPCSAVPIKVQDRSGVAIGNVHAAFTFHTGDAIERGTLSATPEPLQPFRDQRASVCVSSGPDW